MLTLRVASPRRFPARLSAVLCCSALAGCGDTTPGTAAWLFVSLALAAVGAGAYLLGRLRGAAAQTRELRRIRTELRLFGETSENWVWRSDSTHRLQQWRPPAGLGAAPRAADALPREPLPGLFEPARGAAPEGATLSQHLHAERAFSRLRVQALDAGQASRLGGRTWRLSGSPAFDDDGRFAGFVGSARPVDDEEATRAAAAALLPALAAAGPAGVALDEGHGWTLAHVNAAARSAWPTAVPGRALADWTRALPASVDASVGMVEAGRPIDVAGWRLARFDAGAGVQGLWIGNSSPATGGADGASAASGAGSEAEQFSLTVSHDLRAPIRVVEGFTRIVKEDYGALLDRVGNDHLDRVLGAAARMNLMIDALLTLARLSSQPLARQPVNLSQLAGYVVDDLRRGAPEREADIEIEPGLSAHGDPTLLRLVLDNLLGNAWKYTARCPRAHIVMRATMNDGRRGFEVRDNGAGFDMRSAERLFGLFQRLHSANDFPGHGVGLASVRRIVQRHGGEIWAEAEPGRGATFHFTLAG
jgi:hypothetical protein